MTELSLTAHHDGVILDVIAQPRASRTEIAGIRDGAVIIRITAAPVDGAANEAIVNLLSRNLRIGKSKFEIVAGGTSRRKRVLVRGVVAEELAMAFQRTSSSRRRTHQTANADSRITDPTAIR